MTPHKQLNRHRPEEGVFGDCYRTAIACLLDLRPQDVPHVADTSTMAEQDRRMRDGSPSVASRSSVSRWRGM